MTMNLAELNRAYETLEKAKEFAHYCYLLARASNGANAAVMADASSATPSRVRDIFKHTPSGNVRVWIEKAVAGGTTSDSNWATSLAPYTSIARGFLESIRSFSAFDAALPFMMPLPFRTRLMAIAVTGFGGSTVGEGLGKPLTRANFASEQLEEFKSISLVAISDALIKHGTGTVDIISRELRRAVAAETDQTFLSELIDGISPVATSGQSTENFLRDLRNLLNAITIGANARLFLALDPLIMKTLATKEDQAGALAFPTLTVNGGSLAGVAFVPTDGAGSGVMTLFDASQQAANPGTVLVDTSTNAALEMSDAPTQSGTAPTASSVVSMFQTNMTALKAERLFGFRRGRSTSVATMAGVAYDDQPSGS